MILADFRQVEQARNHNQNTKLHKTKHNQNQQTINHERNSSELNHSRTNTNPIPTAQQQQSSYHKNVYSYMDELEIGNLAEFYHDEMEQKRKQEINKLKQAKRKLFQQSINRLYTSGLAKTTQNNKTSQQIIHNLNPANTQNIGSSHQSDQQNNHDPPDQRQKEKENPPKHYYNELYSEEQGFDHKARLKILENQCLKVNQKLLNRFAIKYSIWVAQNESDISIKSSLQATLKPSHPHAKSQIILEPTVTEYFLKSLLTFIFNLQANKTNAQIDTHQRFFTAYSDYINKFQLKQWQKPIENQQFQQKTYDKLKFIAHRLPFVYWLLDFTSLQKIQQVQFNDTSDVFKWIHAKYSQLRPWQLIYQVFQDRLNPKFTVPFNTKLYQVKKPLQPQKPHSQSQQMHPSIKANPSTYAKPQKRPESQKKHTQPQPFSFTQTHSNIPQMTADQLYSWNRNFKAKPVPKTNYQPQLTFKKNPNQDNKKLHMDKFNQQSKFPKTMAYLQNYDEFQEQRRIQLQSKHAKKRTQDTMKPKPIPDFEKIHKKQQYVLEKRKENNRTNTQPKPFNFTETKKSSDINNYLKATLIFDQEIQHEQQKHKKRTTQDTNMPEAKSTAKFDAYITMRKQQRQEKKQQVKEREEIKKRKQEDMKMYKQILKQRMHNELAIQPRPIQYNNQVISQNIVKVNLEDIYLQRPLLMSGTHGQKKVQDDQKKSYTDAFEPII